ncbi:hypothetical protein KCP74_21395 [Salmonella enterica subsp. enterica]|nr:hypothetical protein KCP74_21395 [Salmonella enterica subsp. enterica]
MLWSPVKRAHVQGVNPTAFTYLRASASAGWHVLLRRQFFFSHQPIYPRCLFPQLRKARIIDDSSV